MFPYEANSYFHSDLGRVSTDSPFVHFVVLHNEEAIDGALISSSETQQLTEQREPPAQDVKPQHWLATPLVWLLPIWGAIVWLLLIGTASEAWKLLRYSANSTKQGQRVPCKNCRFFSNNFYLKCAVRPSDALTERAVDCSDFCQKSTAEESKPRIKQDMRH